MRVVHIGVLPDAPLAAAAAFYAEYLPLALAAVAEGEPVTLVFGAADYRHRGWRAEVLAGLAREAAPVRVNGLAGGDAAAIDAALAWLALAPGVTGQLLALDSQGAGEVIG